MRGHLLTAGLALMTTAGTGCVVIDVDKVQSCEPVETTICRIDAIRGCNRIARSEGLRNAGQVRY